MPDSQTLTLSSEDLLSKWGFCDGDQIDDLVWALLGFEDSFEIDMHEVLCRLVETHLVPLLGGLRTYRIGTCHNPIRLLPEDRDKPFLCVEAEIPYAEVERVAREVLAEQRGGTLSSPRQNLIALAKASVGE